MPVILRRLVSRLLLALCPLAMGSTAACDAPAAADARDRPRWTRPRPALRAPLTGRPWSAPSRSGEERAPGSAHGLPPGAPRWERCPLRVGDLPGIAPHLADARLRSRGLLVVSKSLRRAMVFDDGTLRPLGAEDAPLRRSPPLLAAAAGAEGTGSGSSRAGQVAHRACWRIALGYGAPPGPKRTRGDMRTPEGWYRTSDKPWSRGWPGSIAIHYPNLDDARWGFREGLIGRPTLLAIADAQERDRRPRQDTPLGGDILLHGGGSAIDWTDGCVALDDHALDGVRRALGPGARTHALFLP